MARRPRIQLPDAIYHVMSRGNRKSRIFEDDIDRACFIALIATAAERYAVKFYAVCLMTNHYHAVIETPRGNLAEAVRYINGVYAQRTNKRHARTGHLFEGRYRSLIVQRQSYLKRVVRYVALNPVRAGHVTHAADWPWSTHCFTAGLAPCPRWLSTDWMPWAFETSTPKAATAQYRQYVDATPQEMRMEWDAVAVGDRHFTSVLALAAAMRRRDSNESAAASRALRPSLATLFADVTSRRERDRRVAVAHAMHGYRLSEISRFLKRHPSWASAVLRRWDRERKTGESE